MSGAMRDEPWPADAAELLALQELLGLEAAVTRQERPWQLPPEPLVGGCFVAFARGEAGPGRPGDRAWAAAVAWRPERSAAARPRRIDEALRGMRMGGGPRRAADVVDQHVVADRVPASYAPGLLALREGPILAAAVAGLAVRPDVLLVDATGTDHPRRAGLAVHLGAALDMATVGVTHRGLEVHDEPPDRGARGDVDPVRLDGEVVAAWVCTRSGVRPLLVHAGWRTSVETAVAVVLLASTEGARTPVPLQEARRVAREARSGA
jgi:deoxyribonuclease V